MIFSEQNAVEDLQSTQDSDLNNVPITAATRSADLSILPITATDESADIHNASLTTPLQSANLQSSLPLKPIDTNSNNPSGTEKSSCDDSITNHGSETNNDKLLAENNEKKLKKNGKRIKSLKDPDYDVRPFK